MEALASIVEALTAVSSAQALNITFLVIMILGGYYYMFRFVPARDKREVNERAKDRKERQRQQDIEREDKIRMHKDDLKWKESIHNIQEQTNDLLARSSERDKQFSKYLSKLNESLDRMAMVLSSHVETANQTKQLVHDMNEKMPSKDNLKKIHDRLDMVMKDVANHDDVQRIMQQLDNISLCVNKIGSVVNEVRTRQSL